MALRLLRSLPEESPIRELTVTLGRKAILWVMLRRSVEIYHPRLLIGVLSALRRLVPQDGYLELELPKADGADTFYLFSTDELLGAGVMGDWALHVDLPSIDVALLALRRNLLTGGNKDGTVEVNGERWEEP